MCRERVRKPYLYLWYLSSVWLKLFSVCLELVAPVLLLDDILFVVPFSWLAKVLHDFPRKFLSLHAAYLSHFFIEPLLQQLADVAWVCVALGHLLQQLQDILLNSPLEVGIVAHRTFKHLLLFFILIKRELDVANFGILLQELMTGFLVRRHRIHHTSLIDFGAVFDTVGCLSEGASGLRDWLKLLQAVPEHCLICSVVEI